jgi:hypothetical protein
VKLIDAFDSICAEGWEYNQGLASPKIFISIMSAGVHRQLLDMFVRIEQHRAVPTRQVHNPNTNTGVDGASTLLTSVRIFEAVVIQKDLENTRTLIQTS